MRFWLASRAVPRWLHYWAILTVVAALPLLLLGAQVTTLGAGMVDQQSVREPWHLFTVSFSVEKTLPMDVANTGFNITAGAGWKFRPSVGISAEFGYNRLDLSDNILTAVGVPGGNAHIYSVTLEPNVHFNSRGRVGAYLIGGGGF